MARYKDISNLKFGMLTAVSLVNGLTADRCVRWKCVCDCGNELVVKSSSLRSGNTKSCGCNYRKDLTGKRFGRLIVEKYLDAYWHGSRLWQLKCDCGKITKATGNHLKQGDVKSCGCLRLENKSGFVHGMCGTPEFNSFHGAKQRCDPKNKDNPVYACHAGRGIEFRFTSFEEFISEVGMKPEPKNLYSIDRIDNDGHYEKGNVRWATAKEQTHNRRCDQCISYQRTINAQKKEIDRLKNLLSI